MPREKKSVIDILTGGDELPLKIDLEPGTKNVIIASVSILGLSAIITALALRNRKGK